jgi:ABC-type transporter Mla subunit MlaD
MSEPFAFRHLNRLVGVFVISSAVVLLAGVMLLGRARHWLAKEFTVTVAFDRNNLGLLRSGLPVKIQGTDAGEVVSARQDTSHTVARVALREEFRSQLRADAKAIIHTPIAGILGETFIEIWPGQAEAPFSIEDDLITQVPGDDLLQQARASITSIGEAANQLRDVIAENRTAIAGSVRQVEATAASVGKLVEENRTAVNAALTRMETMTKQVEEVIAENRPQVKAATAALPAAVTAIRDTATAAGDTAKATTAAANAITATATDVGATARTTTAVISENRDEVALAMADLRQLMTQAESVTADLKVAAAQVAAGKGSLGKLVMEDTAHDKLVTVATKAEQTLDGIQPIIATISSVKLYLGVLGGENAKSGVTTGSAYLRLEPTADKYYQGGVTYRGAPRDLDPEVAQSEGFPLDFDLLIGWRFLGKDDGTHWFSLGAGVLESRLGGVVSSDIWADRLSLVVQARGTHGNREENDRRYEEGNISLRATASLRVAWRLSLLAGGDDLANHPGAWGGLRLELLDNDLRNLTTFGPLFR